MIELDEIDVRTHDLHGVAERLRLAREHAGLSQQEFADRLGYSRRQVIAWETATNAPPIWALSAVRRECNVDPEWILSGPGKVPLRDAVRLEADRGTRLTDEVAAMAKAVGLTLPAKAIANLAHIIVSEAPEAEREAKKQMRRMLRAISLGQSNE